MGSYMVADEIFLLEMLFQGGFRHIDEALFFVRNYDDNASALILSGDLAGLQERLDPKLASFVSLQISRYRRYLEYYIGTLRSPMSRSQKAALLSHSTGHTARRLLFIVKRHSQNNAAW